MKDCEDCPFFYKDTFTEEQEEGCDIVNGTYGDKAKFFILRSTRTGECWCPLWLMKLIHFLLANVDFWLHHRKYAKQVVEDKIKGNKCCETCVHHYSDNPCYEQCSNSLIDMDEADYEI